MSEIGHNELAVPLAERVREEAQAALVPFVERRDAIVASAQKAFVTDADSTGRAGDLISLAKSLRARAESAVLEVREPVDRARAAIITVEDNWLAPLEHAVERVQGLIETHRTEERAKIREQQTAQRETEDRLRAEAAARRAPTSAEPDPAVVAEPGPAMPDAEPVLPAVRGDYGSLTRDQARTTFTIVDVRALPDEILLAPGVAKAMQTALRAYHRLKPEIPGVIVGEAVKSQTRS